jgi:hypothetical protein
VPTYELARGVLDPGLFSDNAPKMQDFYISEVGLDFIEELVHSPTYRELMFTVPGGKMKIQASTESMQPAVTGYRELIIARPGLSSERSMTDPDGLTVTLVPPGARGVTHVGVVCAVADVGAQSDFLVKAMGAKPVDGGLRVGDTQLILEEAASPYSTTPPFARGFTYITLIVHDNVAAHQALLDAGAQHSARILRLADRCLFSWVKDPSGNWIEMVQYAELSGPLPDVDRLADVWDDVVVWRETGAPF